MHLFTSSLGSFTIHYPNRQEYRALKKEIFTQDCYYFESSAFAPKIIDAGAHIGLATLYFKQLYPFAQVTAIEPNPVAVNILQTNITTNHCSDVTIVAGKLAETPGTSEFFTDATADNWHSTASGQIGAWTGNQLDQKKALTVPNVLLADFLTEEIDFLKMDIEGAELAVLTATKEHLHKVKHLMVEFHPTKNQSLKELLTLLQEVGFSTTLWQDGKQIHSSPTHKNLVIVEGIQKN